MKDATVHHRTQEIEADIERPVDERSEVVADALVGIVGGVALELHAVVIGVVQPFSEVNDGSAIAANGSAAID